MSETLEAARQSAAGTVALLREALHDASRVEGLLLLPMIGAAAELLHAIDALETARELDRR